MNMYLEPVISACLVLIISSGGVLLSSTPITNETWVFAAITGIVAGAKALQSSLSNLHKEPPVA